MKAYEKKKAYKRMIRDQVKAGMVNRPDGNWGRGDDKSMSRDLKGGYKVR